MSEQKWYEKPEYANSRFIRDMLESDSQVEEQAKQWEAERLRQQQAYEAERERRRQARLLLDMRQDSQEYFMKSEGWFVLDPRGRISSRELYALYCGWCEEQDILPYPARAFQLYVSKHMHRYRILHSSNIPVPGGGHVNGYLGIRGLTEEERGSHGSHG